MVEKNRTLGFPTAFAIGLGTMIAAGIFSLSGTAVAEIGSSAVISFVIAAGVAGITAAAYSEFASIYSESGGGYLFSSRTFDNDYLVYTEGVMLFLGYSATTAFYLATMGEWVFEFIYPISPWITASATALLLGWLNARGTKESGAFQILVTGAKVAVLLGFIGGAFAFKAPSRSLDTFMGAFQSDGTGILQIAALAFITFFGFSAIAASAGEIKKPRKTVPRAIAASILTVTVLYTLVIVAMVNSPVPAEIVAEQGETAMGIVAEAFMGPIGRVLIVAGAIFSMVSASNASILAASRIGFLMGREGKAFRRFHEIHRKYGTPVYGVAACTFTIIALIVVFTGIFTTHGPAPFGLHLGLAGLTGFANLNLLIPLSVVNVALILHRRRNKDMERPFRVPLTPIVPALGIAANLALIVSLPLDGIVAGLIGIVAFLGIYYVWGGGLPIEELMTVVQPSTRAVTTESAPAPVEETDRYRVLVPVAREEDVPDLAHLAHELAKARGETPLIEIVHIQPVAEQVPIDAQDTQTAQDLVTQWQGIVDAIELGSDVHVEACLSRDVGFTILELARDREADLIVMGYPTENRTVVETVQHRTPCDMVYAYGVDPSVDLDTVSVGAGGGPNHTSMLPLVDALGARGAEVHVIRVEPRFGGTPEQVQTTLDGLPNTERLEVHQVRESSVSKGLISVARNEGGVLLLGASRDHLLKQWFFGSTPDRVVDLADVANVPVIIYRSKSSLGGRLGDVFFLGYRFLRDVFS